MAEQLSQSVAEHSVTERIGPLVDLVKLNLASIVSFALDDDEGKYLDINEDDTPSVGKWQSSERDNFKEQASNIKQQYSKTTRNHLPP